MLNEAALLDVGLEDVPRQEVVVLAVGLVSPRRPGRVRHRHLEQRRVKLHEPLAQLMPSDAVRSDQDNRTLLVDRGLVQRHLLTKEEFCFYSL